MNEEQQIELSNRARRFQIEWFLRKGQALVCVLYDMDKELFSKIKDTQADCFNDDALIPNFYAAISKKDDTLAVE